MLKNLQLLFLSAILTVMTSNFSFAQIADGSLVPNFTATDINGEEYELYDLLAQGYKVVIDVSATWCGPCWSYHLTGALENLHETYGPEGTQEVFVLFVEGDDSTTLEDLYGTGSSTTGNWVENTPYPILDDAGYIAELLEITYYPTIFTVCSNGLIYETERKTTEEHYQYTQEMECQALQNDAAVISQLSVNSYCETPFNSSISLVNLGTEEINSANITVEGCDNCPMTQSWTGTLGYLETENITFNNIESSNANLTLNYTVDAMDDNDINNGFSEEFNIGYVETTTELLIELYTDCWPEESSWEIVDDMGNITAQSPQYVEVDFLHAESVTLNANSCYTLTVRDSYGDGYNGTAFPPCEVDGYFKCTSGANTLLEIGGQEQFSAINENANTTLMASSSEDIMLNSLTVFPNPASDQIVVSKTDLFENDATLEILSLTGKRIFSQNISSSTGKIILDVSQYVKGTYLLKVQEENQILTKKVIIL